MTEETLNLIWLIGWPIFAVIFPVVVAKTLVKPSGNNEKLTGSEFALVCLCCVWAILMAALWPVAVGIGIIVGIGWLSYQMYLRA